MQKVYLLLRNNQQTGPHTFEELLTLQLKPHDLIWVEGKSYGWRYPAEIESLKPYMATSDLPKEEAPISYEKNIEHSGNESAPKKIFVSMPVNPQQEKRTNNAPVDPIEQKAEELRKKAQAYTPVQESIKTNYSRNLDDAEEEYTKWVYEAKTKQKSKIPAKQLLIASIGILVLVAGWGLSKKSLNGAEIKAPAITQETKSAEPSAESDAQPQNAIVLSKKTVSKPKTEKIKKEKPTKQAIGKSIISQPSITSETSVPEEQPVEQTTTITEENKNDRAVQAPVEKKKTLKEKLGDLFKNKKEETQEEEPKTTDNTNNERKATRREDENATVSVTDVTEQVEIRTNKIADSWMMGVKNVKLTLYNKSNLTVNAAKVEVQYYSDQNDLLDKKIISYANILPKKSQAASIPDNRLADHIDYKILSATGVENAYANR